MNFKIVVILCALCFFSFTWSTGLNSIQTYRFIKLYENKKHTTNENTKEILTQFLREFLEIKEPLESFYYYDPYSTDSINLKNLLLALAYVENEILYSYEVEIYTPSELKKILKVFINQCIMYSQKDYLTPEQLSGVFKKLELDNEKIIDVIEGIKTIKHDNSKINSTRFLTIMEKFRPEVSIFTSYEVDFFLKMFMDYADNDGCLNLDQLSAVLEELKLDDAKRIELTDNLKTKKGEDYVINAADFLLIMMDNKPESNGLSLPQICNLIKFYEDHKTPDGNLEPQAIQNLFKEFDMTTPKHESKLMFDVERAAEKELIELLIVTTDRSRTVHDKDERTMASDDVLYFITTFYYFDRNNDGVLSKEETVYSMETFELVFNIKTISDTDKPTSESVSTPEKILSMTQFDADGNQQINAAEFFLMIFMYRAKYQSHENIEKCNFGTSAEPTTTIATMSEPDTVLVK